MDLLTLAERENELLGREFLTWLWFASERKGGSFKLPEGEEFSLEMEKRVAVDGGEGEALETAVVSGPGGALREARAGLAVGKKVKKAQLHFESGSDAWDVQVTASDFAFSGMKTPKVEPVKDRDDDDPDGAFLEKVYLVERCLTFLDALFGEFLRLRIDKAAWEEETQQVREWIKSFGRE